MSDWYKVYKIAEECSLTTTATRWQCNSIKSWIEANFSDIFECVITNHAGTTATNTITSTTTSDYYKACINIYLTGFNKKIGFFYGAKDTTPTNAMGIKTGESSFATESGAYCDLSTSVFVNNAKLKIIRLKNCFIADFYADGTTKNACRIMVADVGGTKYAMAFRNNELYMTTTTSGQNSYGSFLKAQDYGKKNLTKFVFPWTDTWAEGFYETDCVVDSNVPYTMNGKTYIDISGGTGYRGIAVEAIEGDNEVLYGDTSAVNENE